MLSLYLNTPPQAQLEVASAFLVLHPGFSWYRTLLAILDPFDSVHLDPFSRLVCSYDPSQLPCCHDVGASFATLLPFRPLGLQVIRLFGIKLFNRIC